MKQKMTKSDTKIFDEIALYTKKCSCGHSVSVYPSMKKDYTICTWCNKKVFKDDTQQKIHDEKVKKENFRMKLIKITSSK